MKFAQWFMENELTPPQPEQQLPDARKFSYIACVLYLMEQEKLESAVLKWAESKIIPSIPPNWTWRSHHMTAKPPGVSAQDLEAYKPFFGQTINLTVTEIAADNKCVAVKVKPDKTFRIVSDPPHITIAHSSEVKPQYSNDLFKMVQSIPVPHLVVQAVFVAVMRDQQSTWPYFKNLAISSKVK
jgi:hypothetical protein